MVETAARDPASRTLRRAYAVAAYGFLALFQMWIRQHWTSDVAERTFVDASSTAIAFLAAFLAWRRSRLLEGWRRSSWQLITLAMLSWGIGNAAWTWYEVVAQVEAPFPSWADAGYLMLLPMMMAGILSMVVGTTAAASRLRTTLDGLLIASATLFVAWAIVLRPIVDYASENYTPLEQTVLLSYPVGDIVLLAMLVFVASRVSKELHVTMAWLGVGLLSLAFADLGYWYLNAQGTYETGSASDIGWVGAFLAFGYAAIRPIPALGLRQGPPPGIFLSALPLIPFAAAVVAAVWVELHDGFLDPFLFWLAFFVVAALAARQFVMLWENVQLRRGVEQARDALELRVQERTRDLQTAKEEAEAASKAKSMFLATMSHEIRTPLHGILATASMLEGSTEEPGLRDGVTTIRTSGEHLLSVINNILDFSKMESGKFMMESSPVDPRAIVLEALAIETRRAADKGLYLRSNFRTVLPAAVATDGHRVRQVLINLIDNAIKFTAKGGVTVHLGGARRPDGPYELTFTVEDTGIGITQEAASKLFMPFVQVEGGSRRPYDGTGLGLAICRRLVELMGGKIWIESKPGEGASFIFTIVAHEAVPRPPPAPMTANTASGMHVLLAEDNAVNQKVALQMLKLAGCTADVVPDGAQAVEALRKRAYDAVLMDLHMPVMDGLEATGEIRRIEASLPGRPYIIAMTADALPEDRDKTIRAGMDDYLAKPVRIQELNAALQKAKAHAQGSGPKP